MEIKREWFQTFPRTQLDQVTSDQINKLTHTLARPSPHVSSDDTVIMLSSLSAQLGFYSFLRHTIVDSRKNRVPWFASAIDKPALEFNDFKKYSEATLHKLMLLKLDKTTHSLNVQITLIQLLNSMEYDNG